MDGETACFVTLCLSPGAKDPLKPRPPRLNTWQQTQPGAENSMCAPRLQGGQAARLEELLGSWVSCIMTPVMAPATLFPPAQALPSVHQVDALGQGRRVAGGRILARQVLGS